MRLREDPYYRAMVTFASLGKPLPTRNFDDQPAIVEVIHPAPSVQRCGTYKTTPDYTQGGDKA